ncbi:hypothetical protein A6R68_17361, partial [Neotoma lepida]
EHSSSGSSVVKGKSLSYCKGLVYKQGLKPILRSRELKHMLRKRSGIDPKVLEHRVREAIDRDPPFYHPLKNNCMHFALKLLGMDSVSTSLASQIPNPAPEFANKCT